jgi:hypothetical protein
MSRWISSTPFSCINFNTITILVTIDGVWIDNRFIEPLQLVTISKDYAFTVHIWQITIGHTKVGRTPVRVMMLTSASCCRHAQQDSTCSFSVRQDWDISTQGTAPVYVIDMCSYPASSIISKLSEEAPYRILGTFDNKTGISSDRLTSRALKRTHHVEHPRADT